MSFHFGFSKFGRQSDSICWNTLHCQTSMHPLLLNLRRSTRLWLASVYHTITKFRAALILITGMAHASALQAWVSADREAYRHDHARHESIQERPSTPEKKEAKSSALWHHAIPNYSPTSLLASQMYRVTISWATATTPTTDHNQRLYTNYFLFYRRNYTHWIVGTLLALF